MHDQVCQIILLGPTKEELEEIRRVAEEVRVQKEQDERIEKERLEAEEAAQRKERQEEWVCIIKVFHYYVLGVTYIVYQI